MRIGIVGGGVVGRATARSFVEFHEVRVYDQLKERSTHTLGEVLECDLIFVCLPSPQKPNSLACDVSLIECFFSSYPEYADRNFVLKSTVPIGTTRRLAETYTIPNLVHSPEFLTARCANTDAQMPSRNIIGIPRVEWMKKIDNHPLIDLYTKRFPGVVTFVLTSDESEAVKLFTNAFFATKIAFWNELQLFSQEIGIGDGWEDIMQAILADGRIAHSHTQVPGPDGKYGFGGECLPKDLANLLDCMNSANYGSPVLRSAYVRNLCVDRERS